MPYLVTIHPLSLELVVLPLQLCHALGLLLGSSHEDFAAIDFFFIVSVHGSLSLEGTSHELLQGQV